MAADLSGITLRIGDRSLPAAGGAIAEAVEAANQRARLPDVPDTLNPAIIDPAKAARFVVILQSQPAATLAQMRGHELTLNGMEFGIGATEPTVPDGFGTGFKLVIEEVQGQHVIAHAEVPADPTLAKARAAEAEAGLRRAETAVREVEASHAGGAALSQARRRRAALAGAWRINAAAWARAMPGDAAAMAARDAGKKAAQDYDMPSGGLL